MPIPKSITSAHIQQALERLDQHGVPEEYGPSIKYDVPFNGKVFPPKAVIGLAHEAAHGTRLRHEMFSGGESPGATNPFLRSRGFAVADKQGNIIHGPAGVPRATSAEDETSWQHELWERIQGDSAETRLQMHLPGTDFTLHVLVQDGTPRAVVDQSLLSAADVATSAEVMAPLKTEFYRRRMHQAAARVREGEGGSVSILDAGLIFCRVRSPTRTTTNINFYATYVFEPEDLLRSMSAADAAVVQSAGAELTCRKLADLLNIERRRGPKHKAEPISAAPRTRDILRVLTRLPIAKGQLKLFRALVHADSDPIDAAALAAAIFPESDNSEEQLRGCLAALAVRINNTPRETTPRGRPGLGLMLDMKHGADQRYRYHARSELLDALDKLPGLMDFLEGDDTIDSKRAYELPDDVDREPPPPARRIWVEKSHVTGRADRLDGPHAYSRALISPQASKSGADIYKAMKLVLPGDLVIHVVDNQEVRGVSVVDAVADEEWEGELFLGAEGTDWYGEPHFRVALRDYEPLSPPIDRTSILTPANAQPILEQAKREKKKLFFNKRLEFNQGKYLTEAVSSLVHLLDRLYVESTGQHLPLVGPLEPVTSETWWMFQANPKYYDIHGALASGIRETTWLVKQHAKDIHAGDRVFVWATGGGGVLATATVLTEPAVLSPPSDDPFQVDHDKLGTAATRVRLRYDRVLTSPILRSSVKADPTLASLPILKAPQGTNFPVSASEASRLLELIGTPEIATLEDVHRSFSDALRAANLTFGPPTQHDDFVRAFLASALTKRFVLLTGLSGSGKTQIGKQFGRWLGDGRLKIVAVRPDWTGPEALLGYENALRSATADGRQPWDAPEALRFMLGAAGRQAHPHVLLLDEMNLAHVERYFADVLSGMESGVGCLPNLVEVTDDDGAHWVVGRDTETIRFPANLFVVGTVNVDETTYMFSPKVLDRANTIEFRVQTADLPTDVTKLKRPGDCAEGPVAARRALLEVATDPNWHAQHLPDWADAFAQHLRALHGLLAPYGFEFGHRVYLEAVRFAAIHHAMGGESMNDALDLQLFQKLLPRLHGSRRRLEPVLRALGAFAYHGQAQSDASGFDPETRVAAEAVLARSFDKIRRMTHKLRANQFASFAE